MNEFTLPVASPMSNEAIIFFTAAICLGIIFLFLMYSILVEIRTIKTNSTCILNVLRLLIPKDAKESSKPRVIPTPFQQSCVTPQKPLRNAHWDFAISA